MTHSCLAMGENGPALGDDATVRQRLSDLGDLT